jgi:predicted Abi (CAAX) family protease
VTNRSAKDGARSSWHYGSEGVLTHPSYQGVCGRHGTEDLVVTPGGLVVFSVGAGTSDPISRETKWEVKRGESSDSRIVPQAW